MTFSKEWDARYAEGTHQSVWPWTDIVALVRRHGGNLRGNKALELGCGAGANIPFLLSLGVDYYAIDGSETVVGGLGERFPALRERILVGDFTRRIPFESQFDLIIDRAAVTHNDTEAIRACLALVWNALRPGGLFIGVDWFSMSNSQFVRGEPAGD